MRTSKEFSYLLVCSLLCALLSAGPSYPPNHEFGTESETKKAVHSIRARNSMYGVENLPVAKTHELDCSTIQHSTL